MRHTLISSNTYIGKEIYANDKVVVSIHVVEIFQSFNNYIGNMGCLGTRYLPLS